MNVRSTFTVRRVPRSEFITDAAFRLHYANENSRVARNCIATALLVGIVIGALVALLACWSVAR
jgi:hypothetical protein